MMPLAALEQIDNAGGGALSATQGFVRVDGRLVIRLGDPVAAHGLPPHAFATMASASSFVRIAGIAVCRAGDLASCGDPATGSSHIEIAA